MSQTLDFTYFYSLLNRHFWDFFDNKSRIRISYGGAGSGKSVEAFQDCIYKLLAEPGHNFLICRKVGRTSKISTWALFHQLVNNFSLNIDPDKENINFASFFKFNFSELRAVSLTNSNSVIFMGLDNVEKLKSITFPSGILTDIIIEEASEITQNDFDQLNVRLRGRANVPFQMTVIFNPISDTHWIKKEFFDLHNYQKHYSVYILKSTYLDNKFIDDDYKEILEGYKEISYEFYKVYCLGEWGSYGNLIFVNWTTGKCPYNEEDFDDVYVGIDFGFEHPAVIEKIGFKDGVMYSFDELVCQHKTNMEFISYNEEYKVLKKGERAIADSAEPSRIKEWQSMGYALIGAVKGKDSVSRGIDFIKSQRWIIDPDKCPRMLQEVQTYHWKQDKDGQILDEPVNIIDDAIKAAMYALEPRSRLKSAPGIIAGSMSDHNKDLLSVRREERKKLKDAIKVKLASRKETIKKIKESEKVKTENYLSIMSKELKNK